MADLEELAGRVEALSGPDREVDRDIMLSAVPCDRAPFRYWMPMNEHTGHGVVDVSRVYYGPHCAQAVAVPEFTASIDAAMTLLGENWWSMLSGNGSIAKVGRSGEWAHCSTGEARTPALALTAAALRARTQGNPNG